MSKFIKFISEQDKKDYYANIELAFRIDEGINRNLIIRPSNFKMKYNNTLIKADYEWTVGNHDYFLFFDIRSPNRCKFKFTNYDGAINRTGKLEGVPATSVFSGAILAIKEFLENHKEMIMFSIESNSNDRGRVSLYRQGSKYIAKETGFTYKGEIDDDPEFVQFCFIKEQ